MQKLADTPEIIAARARYRAIMAVLEPPFEETAAEASLEWVDQFEAKYQLEALQLLREEAFVQWLLAQTARQRIIDHLLGGN